MQPKTLKLDKVDVAKYTFDDNVLYLKVLLKAKGLSDIETEDFYTNEISKIEQKNFNMISFLNI